MSESDITVWNPRILVPGGDDFPIDTWTEKLIGILNDAVIEGRITISFPQYQIFDVTLIYPNEVWSAEPRPGCVVGNWVAGAEIEFSMYKDTEGFWSDRSIYNRVMENGANFPPRFIRVNGWEEVVRRGIDPR